MPLGADAQVTQKRFKSDRKVTESPVLSLLTLFLGHLGIDPPVSLLFGSLQFFGALRSLGGVTGHNTGLPREVPNPGEKVPRKVLTLL